MYVHEFCEQSMCVCPSPAQSARLCVETDFIIDTEATLICCKRFGNWSPLAGVIVKPGLQNSVSLPVLVQLSCVGIALEMATPVGSTPSFWRGLVLTFPQGCTAWGRPGAPLPLNCAHRRVLLAAIYPLLCNGGVLTGSTVL